MDELTVSGKKYISSKRASEITGYAKDYIGQLSRGGKVAATRFGRAWYVEESALLAYLNPENKEGSALQSSSATAVAQKPLSPQLYTPYNLPKTWSPIKYLEDSSDLLPAVMRTIPEKEPEIAPRAESVRITKIDIVSHAIPQASHMGSVQGMSIKNVIPPDMILPAVMKPKMSLKIDRVSVKKAPPSLLPLVPAGVFALSLALFIFLASGLFVSSEVNYKPLTEGYTASVFSSFENLGTIFQNSPFIQNGLQALSLFWTSLTGSFWSFFSAGLNFLKSF